MQAKSSNRAGFLPLIEAGVVPTQVKPVRFKKTDPATSAFVLSLDLAASQRDGGNIGIALPEDGRFDRDAFPDLARMPAATAAALIRIPTRASAYHVIPDPHLGRTTQ